MAIQLNKKILFAAVALAFVAPATAGAATIGKVQSNNLGLVGYWTLDGSKTNWATGQTTDSSGNANTGQLISMSTSTSPITGKVGQGLKFDGVDDYIPVGTGANPTTNSFSVVFWQKSIANTGGDVFWTFISNRQNASPFTGFVITQRFSGTVGALRFQLNDTAVNDFNLGVRNVSNNVWHHIVLSVNRTSNVATVYVDGAIDFSADISALTGSISSSNPIEIARDQAYCPASGCRFAGTIDDVRIYNRALSANEVKQLYDMGAANAAHSNTAAFNNGLVGYWTFDGSKTNWATGQTTDSSGNSNTGRLISMSTTTSPVAGKVGQALRFNGANTHVDVSNSTSLDTSVTKRLTVSGWVKVNRFYTGTCNFNMLASKGTNINTTNGVYQLSIANVNECTAAGATNFAYFSINVAGTRYNIKGTTNLTTGVWHHLVAVYDGSTISIYVNGVSDQTPTATAGTLGNTNEPITIGYLNFSGFEYWVNGTIDDTRVYNRALSDNEIKQLYNAGVANVAHSNTAALSSGLVGYWTFDGSKTNWTANTTQDSSGQGNTGQLISMSTSTSPVAGKIGQALIFDGGNYISTPTQSISGSITVSAWINGPCFILCNGYFVSKGRTTDWALAFQSTQLHWYSSNVSIACTPPTVNGWHHVVATQNGTDVRLYINGTQCNSGTLTAFGNGSNPILIGDDPSSPNFVGKIDDVRVYNRALSASEVQQLYNMGR